GPGNMSVDVTRPAGPGRCAGSTGDFFYDEVSDETAAEMRGFANQVGAEDASLVASVQLGLSSGMISHGRLLPSSEHLIQHFQRLVPERVSAAPEARGPLRAAADRPEDAQKPLLPGAA